MMGGSGGGGNGGRPYATHRVNGSSNSMPSDAKNRQSGNLHSSRRG